jgi:hypothetical protein
MPGVGAVLEPIQDLPVRRIGRDFYVLQGKKPQEYLLYCKVFNAAGREKTCQGGVLGELE